MDNLGIVNILPAIANEGDIAYYNDQVYEWHSDEWRERKINGSFPLTNYVINKMVISQLPSLSPDEILDYKNIIYDFTHSEESSNYYMLLCNEEHDYTVFMIDTKEEERIEDVVIEVINSRGILKQINVLEDNSAIEFWITNEKDTIMYMLFSYDWGVIKCQ